MDKGRDIISKILSAVKGSAPAAILAPPEDYGDYLKATSPDAAALNAQVNAKLDSRPRFLLKIEGGGQAAKRTRGSFMGQSYPEYTEEGEDYDYVMHIRAGDVLTRDALYEFALSAANEPDIIYCDEDYFDVERTAPVFKPEVREFTLLSYNMIGWPLMVRRGIYESIQPPDRQDDTAQYGYVLRAVRAAESYSHIKKPLYTRYAVPNVLDAAAEDIDAYLDDRPGEAVPGLYPGSFRVTVLPEKLSVGMVIPNLDGADELRRFMESAEQNTLYHPFSFIIVDYGSKDSRLLDYYELLEKNKLARIVRLRGYNFPLIANQGAKRAGTDLLLFISRDMECRSPHWLTALVETAQRGAAAVGGKILDSRGGIMYAGGVVGLRGWTDSPYRGVKDDFTERRKNSFVNTIRTVSALNKDMMLIDSERFFNAGGFDESFIRFGADTELCIRLMRRGGECVYDPYSVIRRHGELMSVNDAEQSDLIRLYDTVRPMLELGDPSYNPNYDYASLTPRAAKQPYPAIMLNPMYE